MAQKSKDRPAYNINRRAFHASVSSSTTSIANEELVARPKIISRAAAKAVGLKRYFTGLPCSNGHIAERHVRQGNCTECLLEEQREARLVLAALHRKPKDDTRRGAVSSHKDWVETLPDLPRDPLRRAAEIGYRALAIVIMTRELSVDTNAIAVAGFEALQDVRSDENAVRRRV
jgi:hypothetical protein